MAGSGQTEMDSVRELRDLLPFRTGYHLAEKGRHLCGWPDIPYRGDNRQYFGPSEDDYIEFATGRRRGGLPALWDRYKNSDESGALNLDADLARRFAREFAEYDVDLEVMYVELTALPKHLDGLPPNDLQGFSYALKRWRRVHDSLGARPQALAFLGFDLSHPQVGFHSAIWNPGLHKVTPDLPDQLNRDGLFDDVEAARRFLPLTERLKSDTYCVLAIWEALA